MKRIGKEVRKLPSQNEEKGAQKKGESKASHKKKEKPYQKKKESF